jgi:putative addiction module component (TIGR02574 family)
MKRQKLEAEIMKLTPEDRAELAEKILLSLEEPSEAENEQLWLVEAERRLQEMRAGTVPEIPASEVFKRAKAAIS